jgi:chemotaxis protein MotA
MALVHPAELLTIGGAALGSLIVMSPGKVLKDLAKGLIATLKGSPYNKKAYEQLFKAMYELLRVARREGMLGLESHMSDPHASTIFSKYPLLMKDHHALDFIVSSLAPVIDGTVNAEQLPKLLNAELRAMEDEHHAPMGVLSKVADALPGFGIVAAVLGIVITMGHIDGPVEEIGHKVGAALVGTFLGILASYGFIAPLVVKMEFMGAAEMGFFRTIAAVVQGFVDDLPPKVAIDMARRSVSREVRPTTEEMEALLKEAEAA